MGGANAILGPRKDSQGRIPLHRAGAQSSRLRRARQRGGARCSPILRAARLPCRDPPGAMPICSARRNHARAYRMRRRDPRCHAKRWRHFDRAIVGHTRRPAERSEGGGQDHRAELGLDQYQRAFCADAGKLRADLCRRRAGAKRRRRLYPAARAARRSHREAGDVSGGNGCGKITFTGNPVKLGELMALMDEFPRMFEIVEPKRTVVT